MIPHCGGDTQRDNRFIKPHTRADTAKHTKGAKRTMSAYTPCALRFYTPVLRLTAVTLTHVSEETRHSHEEGREESALAQVLFNMGEQFFLSTSDASRAFRKIHVL